MKNMRKIKLITPVSTSDKPRLISPGNVFARIIGDASVFKSVSTLTLTIDKALLN
jgi:hypothetical protein